VIRCTGAGSALPLLALAMLAGACRPAGIRVWSEDSQCAATLPGEAGADWAALMLEGGLALGQQSWVSGHVGSPETVAPLGNTAHVLRRLTAPKGTAVDGMPLLEMAGRQLERALQGHGYLATYTRPLTRSAGVALEVGGADMGALTETRPAAVIRLYALADGYCEAAIFGARSQQEVEAFFATVAVGPAAAKAP
jgi:hypothetical protein